MDNFCWPDPVESESTPDGAYKMAQLVRSNQALQDVCLAYGLPLISGKDSMKNDYHHGSHKISVPPTLLVTAAAIVPNIRQAMTSYFKAPGQTIYLLGETHAELGGGELFAWKNYTGNKVPQTDPSQNIVLYRRLHQAIQQEIVTACHDLSDGGLACALAEMAIGGELGVEVELSEISSERQPIEVLYSESQGRFLITVTQENEPSFEKILAGTPFQKIGCTTNNALVRLNHSGKSYLEATIEELSKSWREALA